MSRREIADRPELGCIVVLCRRTRRNAASRQSTYEVKRKFSAPPEVVFEILADAPGWPSWCRPVILQSRWERTGDQAAGGVGAIRSTGTWPFMIREEIIEYKPPTRLAYTYVGRWFPVKDYVGTVVFAAAGEGGTEMSWSASFTNVLPGGLVRAIAKYTVVFMAARLQRESAKRAGA